MGARTIVSLFIATPTQLSNNSSDKGNQLLYRMPFYDQGDSQGCATTSLSMVCEYFGIHMSREEIDKAVRRVDSFLCSSLDNILEFARDHGLEAEGYDNGIWEEVKSMIDQGYPVLACVDSDCSVKGTDSDTRETVVAIGGPHLITITGYGTDPATAEEYVLYHDPNYGNDPATRAKEGDELRMSLMTSRKPGAKKPLVGLRLFHVICARRGRLASRPR